MAGRAILGAGLLAVWLVALSACAFKQDARTMAMDEPGPDSSPLRLATFNVAMEEQQAGQLLARLSGGADPRAQRIAAIIQHLRPDVILLNEIDYDPEGRVATIFQQEYLERGQFGQAPIEYPYRILDEVNTGVPSGLDVDGDGQVALPGDGWGFGRFPGQYGMLLLSRFPIDHAAARSFRLLRWAEMPGALQPVDPETGDPWYPEATWRALRLSSKSHWDVPVDAGGLRIHVLAAHPTPPVFDGPEDRNGRRNHDEIRLWADYLDPQGGAWIVDDRGRPGALAADAHFVILGDYNADPVDGDSVPGAIQQLLDHPRVRAEPAPRSSGGGAAAARLDGGANATQRGDPAHDSGRFNPERVGNLRLDYALPSRSLRILANGVFWPAPGEPGSDWVEASDHRLVWVDVVGGE